jgi:hypothetical protein
MRLACYGYPKINNRSLLIFQKLLELFFCNNLCCVPLDKLEFFLWRHGVRVCFEVFNVFAFPALVTTGLETLNLKTEAT